MNSQHIRSAFGSYVVDVLHQTAALRIASLSSVHGGRHVCRTLAATRFLPMRSARLEKADRLIRAGASIGETLMKLGFTTEKTNDCWLTLGAGPGFARLTGGEISSETPLTVRVYTLRVTAPDACIDYAVIAEAYHPAHIARQPIAQDATRALDHQYRLALSALQETLSPADSTSSALAQRG